MQTTTALSDPLAGKPVMKSKVQKSNPLLIPLCSSLMDVPATKSELFTSVDILASLVLDSSWLSQVYEGQSNSSNKDMAKLVALDQGNDAIYSIQSVHGLE